MLTTHSEVVAAGRLDQTEVVPAAAATEAAATPAPGLTIVVPYRATSAAPRPKVQAVAAALGRYDGSVEIVAIPYGPTTAAANPAQAVRRGMAGNASPIVGWIDGDAGGDPEHIPGFLRVLDLYDADGVVGSKQHPESHVGLCWRRQVGGRAYRTLLRVLFGTRLGDPRIGIKVFRRRVLDDVLPYCEEAGSSFDVEVLLQAHRRGHRLVIEAPVRVDHSATTPIGIGHATRLLRDTVALRWRLGR